MLLSCVILAPIFFLARQFARKIDQFKVVYLVTWPLGGNEAGVYLVSIETFPSLSPVS